MSRNDISNSLENGSLQGQQQNDQKENVTGDLVSALEGVSSSEKEKTTENLLDDIEGVASTNKKQSLTDEEEMQKNARSSGGGGRGDEDPEQKGPKKSNFIGDMKEQGGVIGFIGAILGLVVDVLKAVDKFVTGGAITRQCEKASDWAYNKMFGDDEQPTQSQTQSSQGRESPEKTYEPSKNQERAEEREPSSLGDDTNDISPEEKGEEKTPQDRIKAAIEACKDDPEKIEQMMGILDKYAKEHADNEEVKQLVDFGKEQIAEVQKQNDGRVEDPEKERGQGGDGKDDSKQTPALDGAEPQDQDKDQDKDQDQDTLKEPVKEPGAIDLPQEDRVGDGKQPDANPDTPNALPEGLSKQDVVDLKGVVNDLHNVGAVSDGKDDQGAVVSLDKIPDSTPDPIGHGR